MFQFFFQDLELRKVEFFKLAFMSLTLRSSPFLNMFVKVCTLTSNRLWLVSLNLFNSRSCPKLASKWNAILDLNFLELVNEILSVNFFIPKMQQLASLGPFRSQDMKTVKSQDFCYFKLANSGSSSQFSQLKLLRALIIKLC